MVSSAKHRAATGHLVSTFGVSQRRACRVLGTSRSSLRRGEPAAAVLGVSQSGYYAWRKRKPSARAVRHKMLTEIISGIHADSRGSYGHRRVHAELTIGRGLPVGRQQVATLMRRAGLQGATGRRKYQRGLNEPTAGDLVQRKFNRDVRDRLWATDLTEHPTAEGKIYCCVVLDTYSRLVVGWAIDSSPNKALATNALSMAISAR